MITHKKFFLTEAEIMNSEPYKQFTELLITKGAELSTRVEDNNIFEFAFIEVEPGLSHTLTTVNSRIWSLATAFMSLSNVNDVTVLYAFNKDIVDEMAEELLNG